MAEQKWEKVAPSFSLKDDRLVELKNIVPEAFTDGKIDFEVLRELLGDTVEDESAEHFGLNWTGKREARRLAGMPSKGTLVPVPGKGLHEDTTENIFIEGDNLEVLKLLHKSYRGKIKMIYIDPPYNTGNDFIYKDDYRMPLDSYLERSGQKSDAGELLTSNPKSSGRFHSNWLNMIYPRLRVARDLLKPSGVIFASIDETELSNLRQVLNEIFGEENFVGIICWKNVTDNNPTLINKDNEFVVCFCKDRSELPQSWKSFFSDAKELMLSEYDRLKRNSDNPGFIQDGLRQFINDNTELVGSLSRYKFVDEEGIYTGSESVHNPKSGGYVFDVLHPETQKAMRLPANGYRFPETTFRQMEKDGVIIYGEDEKRIVKIKKYLKDYEDSLRSVIIMDGRLGSYDLKRVFQTEKNIFSNPKPVDLLATLISFATGTNEKEIILDLFAGAATTAEAVLELNRRFGGDRRFILCQIHEAVPEKSAAKDLGYDYIDEITTERIRRSIQKVDDAKGSGSGPLLQRVQLSGSRQDLGFKAFRLESSNFKAWTNYRGSDLDELRGLLQTQLDSNFADGATEGAILTEILLLEGFPLTSKIEVDESFQKNVVRRISHEWSEHRLFVTLDKEIQEETIRTVDEMIESEKMSKLEIFICLDNALTDQDKLRLADVCRLKTI